jgi:hypothetical protein
LCLESASVTVKPHQGDGYGDHRVLFDEVVEEVADT